MMFGDQETNEMRSGLQEWEPVRDRELRLREDKKRSVSVEDCGKVIGRIIFPIDAEIFGPCRGAVYLTRD